MEFSSDVAASFQGQAKKKLGSTYTYKTIEKNRARLTSNAHQLEQLQDTTNTEQLSVHDL